LVVSDAFDSEMVRYADLVLPDTTYFERYDVISLLDRPISEPDSVGDAIRHPILKPDRDVRAWQEVLVDLAGRLQFPAFVNAEQEPKFKDYPDFITRFERAPGIGFLAGFRGKDGESPLKGEPNPNQWAAYIEAQSFFAHHWPDKLQWMRFCNQDYLNEAVRVGFIGKAEQIVLQLYSEPLQKLRLSGEGLYPNAKPNATNAARLREYADPLPIWYPPIADNDEAKYPLHAITQRPMMMYHAWDSQNAWLRQILAQNFLYLHPDTAAARGIADHDWVWVVAAHGKIRCQVKTMLGCERNTVWTWNAIGKMAGTWGLDKAAKEATHGFLLNHLIAESIKANGATVSNSDPITGQAAWYDLRVEVVKA
jgi:sulfite dehydrogenase (quinone) subunit SoeA